MHINNIPLTPDSVARETGLNSQPRLSLVIGEGKWELNLTKLAFTSSSSMELRFWKSECCNLRETHVIKTRIERRRGKAWGLFKKLMRKEREEKLWMLKELASEFWEFSEYEFLLGFAIFQSNFLFKITRHTPALSLSSVSLFLSASPGLSVLQFGDCHFFLVSWVFLNP